MIKNKDMKDIDLIKDLLLQASELLENNIENAHNFDCEHMSQVLDQYVTELHAIGDFEVYED